jgi:hypothetical protein
MYPDDPITDPLGLERPEREDDRDLPPARTPTMTIQQIQAELREMLKKAEAERIAQLELRIWTQR